MTKDEFLDAMGGIDERLIDSTLDVSRMDTIYVPYKRRSVLKYFIGAAACLAVVFAVAGTVRYFNLSPFFTPNSAGSSEETSSQDASSPSGSSTDSSNGSPSRPSVPINRDPDYVRGWDPGSVAYNTSPLIGESAVVSTAELDGIKVSLVLHDVTKLPGTAYSANGFDYTDYWGAKDIVLYAEDGEGRKVAEERVTPHRGGGASFLHKDCVFDGATRLYKISDTDSEAYIVMQYTDCDARTGALIASFWHVDTESGNSRKDEYWIADYGLSSDNITGIKRIGGWRYGYQASKDFTHKEGTTFTDPEYGYEMTVGLYGSVKVTYPTDADVDPKNTTGFDPDKLEYDPYPECGETAIVSVGEADGMKVSLIMYNVIKRPGEDNYLYSGDGWYDVWIAENIYLYITDDQGRRVLGTMTTPLFTDYSKQLPGECLFEGCTRVYKTDSARYLIMQYYDYDAESGEFSAYFTEGDMELYTSSAAPLDENGISVGGGLWPIEISGEAAHTYWAEAARVSKSFEYIEGSTFADTEYSYTATFDFDNHTCFAEPS